MVRLEILRRFGPAAGDAGYKVYTTIDGRLQKAANRALRIGLIDYSRRQGWRGATNRAELTGNENTDALEILLDEYGSVGMLQPAIVISVAEKQARVYVKGLGLANIEWAGMSWAKRRTSELALGPDPKSAGEIVARGDVVYVVPGKADGPVELAPGAGSRKRAGGAGSQQRRDHVAGRRLRLLRRPGQVQPRDTGEASAWLGIQTVHVRGSDGGRVHAGFDDSRCADHHGRSQSRRSLATGKFWRRLSRANAPARSTGAVAQPGVDSPPQGNGHRTGRSTTCRTSASGKNSCPGT